MTLTLCAAVLVQLAAKYPALTEPPLSLRHVLRSAVLGVRFWSAATSFRNRAFGRFEHVGAIVGRLSATERERVAKLAAEARSPRP